MKIYKIIECEVDEDDIFNHYIDDFRELKNTNKKEIIDFLEKTDFLQDYNCNIAYKGIEELLKYINENL